jgi:tetratricopeptide (TPR) repeat protein
MSRIDDTRQNIGTKKMSDEERKQMFKKFVDGGGEIISERPKRHSTFDREKQKTYRDRIEQQKQQMREKSNNPSSKKRSSSGGSSENHVENNLNPIVRYFHLLNIRFNLLIRGVTDASGKNIKKNFIQQFNSEYKTAIMHFQMLYIELFKNIDYSKSQLIIDKMDKSSPLHFELIEMAADIYDREVTAEIIDEYIAFNQSVFHTASMREPFMEYYKRIYLIYSSQSTLMGAYEKAFDLYTKAVKKGMDIPSQRRKTRNSIYIVFNKFYPKLYWLFCYYNRQIISQFDFTVIDNILGINPDMKPGTRTASSPSRLNAEFAVKSRKEREAEEAEKMEEAREELKKKSAPQISEEVKRGLELMSQINYDGLSEKYLKNLKWNFSYESNPTVKAFLVFQEFDEEYSVIFTTNKIKIAAPHDRRHEADFRIILSEFYNQIRHIEDEFKNYFSSLESYEGVRNDRPTNQAQYFNYSKRLTELEKTVHKRESILRSTMRNFFTEAIDRLEELTEDMEKKQKIVLNPQEEIEFNYELEGNKKLKGKKIYQAILSVIDFSSAFVHRLSHNNDLSGQTKLSQPAVSTEDEADNIENIESDGSIIDELDNFI